MALPKRFINRELSWLEFNQRVLDEATCTETPALERLKFLAITGSNLDEFFMVRVGGLKLALDQGIEKPDPAGMLPSLQLELIGHRVRRMIQDQYECLLQGIEPVLAQHDFGRVGLDSLSDADRQAVDIWFSERIEPILSPVAVGSHRRMPLLRNLGLHVLARLKPAATDSRRPRFAVIPIDVAVDRVVPLPADRGFRYILLEDVIRLLAERFFAGEEVVECVAFRITRNADMAVDEDGDVDLLAGMEEVLQKRRKSECVRLELEAGCTRLCYNFLKRQLRMHDEDIYEIPGPIDLSDLMCLTGQSGFASLRHEQRLPRQPVSVEPQKSMFEQISRQDILLSHPYESYTPVVRFVEEAAADEDVLAIKMTLYRTSRQSRIVDALSRAALDGKYVTALVELKARFDEERNILWAKRLEEDGVQVIHGVRGLKTHAKICLVVRKESRGIVRYMHFGTGNYNETTARLYSDMSLMSKDEDLGDDASAFFNAVTGYSVRQTFLKLTMAPSGLRERLLELIQDEIERVHQGQRGLITAKMNSLVDRRIIEALYDASQAGVTIRLNVRGICCLRPGVAGLSENIRVVSIVDRFLEHGRVFHFLHGGENLLFISSADWMPRNLDRRVELLVPVQDPNHRKRLIRMLETYLDDHVKGRDILADGSYSQRTPDSEHALASQETLYRQACEQEHEMLQHRRTVFEPHQRRS